MSHLHDQLFKLFVDLDTFSRLPTNTSIHLSKSGYFVPTAGTLSGIPGAQSISNYFNNYTPEQLCLDLQNFVNQFVDILSKCQTDSCLIKLSYQQFKLAVGDDQHGLFCLIKTYPDYDIQLLNIINSMNTFLTNLINNEDDVIDLRACPEQTLSDEHWMLLMNNSLHLQYETTSLYKFYVLYNSSLLFNHVMMLKWHWFDHIHTFNDGTMIMLGGMPLKASVFGINTRNDLQLLYNNNIKAVLSVVECFENTSTGFIYNPIMPHEWAPYDIYFLQIPIPDFCDVSIVKIDMCVEYIHWCVKKQLSIYISCRVGKNRSVLVLAAYFVKYLKMTSQQAFDYIQSKRPQVQNGHIKILQLYENYYK
jgi:protein-tyrosine phosphatase